MSLDVTIVPWLIKYKEACEDNPGCKIKASI